MQVTFTVSTEQAVEMCAFYDKLQEQAYEEVKIAADKIQREANDERDFEDESVF